MDNLSHFHSLEELIRALDRERKLLHALFQDRKKLSFRYELARELASKKGESIEFLSRYGVIRENTDLVELEEVYLKFFEDVLEVNEEINVASVKESIGNLNNAIDYYLSENNPSRKYGYLRDQMLLDTNTDILAKLQVKNPVWMEPRPRYRLKVSLSMLRNSEEGLKVLKDIAKGKKNSRLKKGNLAEPLTEDELTEQQQILQIRFSDSHCG